MLRLKNVFCLWSISTLLVIRVSFAQVTWLSPTNITSNSVWDSAPSLDVGQTRQGIEGIHLAFTRWDVGDSRYEIAYAWKTLSGTTWSISFATDKSQSGAPDTYNWNPSIKADGFGFVYIAYRGDFQSPPGEDNEIFYIDNVFGFGLPTNFSNNSTDDLEPSLALDGSTAHIAYVATGGVGSNTFDYEIWFDGTQVTEDSYDDVFPSLVIDSNGKAHIAYAGMSATTGSDYEIWYAENITGSWVIHQVTDNDYSDTKPSLIIDPTGYAHIAWQGKVEADFDIYYSNNISGNFTDAFTRVTAKAVDEVDPSLVIDPDGAAHIAYQGYTVEPSDEEIFYTHNMSGIFTTQTTGETQVSTNITSDDKFPSLDIDSNKYLHLAYQGIDGGYMEILYTKTTHPVPVELANFEATVHRETVALSWQTASETNNYGFDIERKSDPQTAFMKIGFVQGHGTTSSPHYYSFKDQNLSGGRYYYRLKQIDFDGSYTYSKAVQVQLEGPAFFSLSQNYPNPFNPITRISYQLPQKLHVQVKIYDILGKEVKTIEDSEKEAGSYSAIWDGKDDLGKDVASGIYIYRIQAGNFHAESRKMLLVR